VMHALNHSSGGSAKVRDNYSLVQLGSDSIIYTTSGIHVLNHQT
jgi:hypothetical protein